MEGTYRPFKVPRVTPAQASYLEESPIRWPLSFHPPAMMRCRQTPSVDSPRPAHQSPLAYHECITAYTSDGPYGSGSSTAKDQSSELERLTRQLTHIEQDEEAMEDVQSPFLASATLSKLNRSCDQGHKQEHEPAQASSFPLAPACEISPRKAYPSPDSDHHRSMQGDMPGGALSMSDRSFDMSRLDTLAFVSDFIRQQREAHRASAEILLCTPVRVGSRSIEQSPDAGSMLLQSVPASQSQPLSQDNELARLVKTYACAEQPSPIQRVQLKSELLQRREGTRLRQIIQDEGSDQCGTPNQTEANAMPSTSPSYPKSKIETKAATPPYLTPAGHRSLLACSPAPANSARTSSPARQAHRPAQQTRLIAKGDLPAKKYMPTKVRSTAKSRPPVKARPSDNKASPAKSLACDQSRSVALQCLPANPVRSSLQGALHTTSTISDPCHSSTAALPLQRQGSTPTLLKLSTSAKVNKAQKPSSGLPPPEPAKPCTPLKPRVNRSMPHKRQLRKIESSINNHHPDTKSFIRVLWDECDNEANKDYLRWDGEGLRLLVRLQSTELGQKVLLPHFGHANGASFLRQLNVYTFVRLHRDSLQTVLASNNLLDAPPTDPWSCFFQDDWIRSGGTDNLRKITANSKFARQDPPAHKTRLARINASAKLARVAVDQ